MYSFIGKQCHPQYLLSYRTRSDCTSNNGLWSKKSRAKRQSHFKRDTEFGDDNRILECGFFSWRIFAKTGLLKPFRHFWLIFATSFGIPLASFHQAPGPTSQNLIESDLWILTITFVNALLVKALRRFGPYTSDKFLFIGPCRAMFFNYLVFITFPP